MECQRFQRYLARGLLYKVLLIALYHFETLIQVRAEFVKLHPQYLAPNSSMKFIPGDDGSTYNGCHCGFFCLAVKLAGR